MQLLRCRWEDTSSDNIVFRHHITGLVLHTVLTANAECSVHPSELHREPAKPDHDSQVKVISLHITTYTVTRYSRVSWAIYLLSPRPNANLSCAIHGTEARPAYHILDPPLGPPWQPSFLPRGPCQSFLCKASQVSCPAGFGVSRSRQVHAQ